LQIYKPALDALSEKTEGEWSMAHSDAERREGTGRDRVEHDTRVACHASSFSGSASSFSFFDSTSLKSLGDFQLSEEVAPHGTQWQAWRMDRRLSQEGLRTICSPQRQAESATVLSAGQPGTVLQALPMIP
jgi:hypothetical protein